MLADPPYSAEDAAHYVPGSGRYPKPGAVLRAMLAALKPGQRCGILHYLPPRPPKDTRFIACIGVVVGFDNRIRCYSVYERTGR